MTASRDPDRLIREFLMDGQTELADQVYDAVRATVEQRRQRAVIGPWRMPNMNKYVPIGGVAVAAVLALVVGTRLLAPPAPGGVGNLPSVQPTATASPSAAPSVVAPSTSPSATASRQVVLRGVGGPAITVTLPNSAWTGDGVVIKNRNADPPKGAAIIGPFVGDLYVFGDPCKWSASTPKTPATSVAEAAAALTAQASRDASAAVDVTVDGHAGKSITLHVPDDAVFTSHGTEQGDFPECDELKFASWAGGGEPLSAGPSRYHQGPGQIDELWILDVDGELIVMDAMYGPQTPAQDIAELHAILESMTFKK